MRPTPEVERRGILVAEAPFRPWFDPASLTSGVRDCFERCEGGLRATGPGYLSVEGRLSIVLPRAYGSASDPGLARDDVQHEAGLLSIRTLRRFMQRAGKSVVTQAFDLSDTNALAGANHLLEALENKLLLRHDRRCNGLLYVTEERCGTRQRGRIDWPRTLHRTTPIADTRGASYPWPVRRRHAVNPRHPVTALHNQACAEVAQLLGLGPGPQKSLPRLEAQRVLESFQAQVFSDRARYVHRLLRRYYGEGREGRSAAAQKIQGLFAKRYEYVWEAMLQEVLRPLRQERMTGAYVNGGARISGARLIPDLVLDAAYQGRPVRLVLDAKHYRAEKPPATESLTKQLVYRHLLSNAYRPEGPPPHAVGSAFLIPQLLPLDQPARVLYVHELDGDTTGFGRVVVVAVDLRRVSQAYAKGQTDHGLRQAIVDLVMGRFSPV